MSESQTNGANPQDEQVDDTLPVLAAQPRPIERAAESPLQMPAVAATGGFLAGIATLVLVRVLRRSAQRQRRGVGIRRGRRGGRSLEVTGSRSFLVDVHMLKR